MVVLAGSATAAGEPTASATPGHAPAPGHAPTAPRACRRHVLTEKECKRFMGELLSAVEHIHRCGVLHRDLKLENLVTILLDYTSILY